MLVQHLFDGVNTIDLLLLKLVRDLSRLRFAILQILELARFIFLKVSELNLFQLYFLKRLGLVTRELINFRQHISKLFRLDWFEATLRRKCTIEKSQREVREAEQEKKKQQK